MNVQDAAITKTLSKIRQNRTALALANAEFMAATGVGDTEKAEAIEKGMVWMQDSIDKQSALCLELIELAAIPWEFVSAVGKEKIRKAAGV
tara:strand:- start:936 stop:1208 length:273 start_codon:yes stop_codon:yes gene_type:complete